MVFPNNEYFKMPNAMFGTKRRRGWIDEIGHFGLAVYAFVLRRYDFGHERGMYESHASMAKRIGIAERTLETHLRRLVGLGLIGRVPCGKRRYEQVIYVPRLPMPEPPEESDEKRDITQSGAVINTQTDTVITPLIPKLTQNNTVNDDKGDVTQLFEKEEVKVDLGGPRRLFKRLNIYMSNKEEIKHITESVEDAPMSEQLQVVWQYWCHMWEDHYQRPYYPARRNDNAKVIPKDKKNLRDKIEAVGVGEVLARIRRCFEVCDTIFPCFVNGKWQRPITLSDFVNNHFFDQWIVPAGDSNEPAPKGAADKVKAAMEKRCRTTGRSDEDDCSAG